MSLNLSVRRGQLALGNTPVVVFIGADECARGVTDASGALLLSVPATGAPARCSEPGAVLRFRVGGQEVSNVSVAFSPQGAGTFELVLP